MLSCSHWGMFPKPQAKFTKAWYQEQRDLNYYDAEYIHGILQRIRS